MGSSWSAPDSFVYRFNKTSQEINVIKTRTLHLPTGITELVGNLQEYKKMDTDKIDCNDYRNDPILLINSTYWKKFSESGCNLKAAIIKMDNDLRNRISSPLSSSSAHAFPIILMYNKDEEHLGKA